MKLKEKTIEAINHLDQNKLALVYDLIQALEEKNSNSKESTKGSKAREALLSIKGTMANEIINNRDDRV